MTPLPFATLLLAGGRSERMGRDKAFLEWGGDFLWQIQINKLLSLKPSRLILSCREEQRAQFDSVDSAIEWFFDPPGFQLGPMAIIEHLLRSIQLPLIVLAVDMPQMTADFIQSQLLAEQNFMRGRCFSTKAGLEPLAALYIPSMQPVMAQSMAAGQRSLQMLLSKSSDVGLVEIKAATDLQEPFFANCNTPTEWEHEKGRSKGPA